MRVLVFFCALAATAADWTGFGGPHGDFRLTAQESALTWPAAGPKRLWSRDLGEGFSPIVASGGRLFTLYRRGNDEVIIALDSASGKTLWEHAYPAPLMPDFDTSYGTGPRASPLFTGGRLFTVGATGIMYCLDPATGKVHWSRNFSSDFKGKIRNSGYSPSPIAWRDTVIVFPWAQDGAIAALRQSDGAVVWRKHNYVVSYSTPMFIRLAGRDHLLALFSDEVTGLDPATGDLLWSHPHTNDQKVNVALPVWREQDHLLFLSSAYDGGSRTIRLTQDGDKIKTEELWSHRQLRIHHSNAVRVGGTIYGPSGDFGPCPFTALDMATGKLLWRDRAFPKSSPIVAGAKLLLLDEEGTLTLGTPTEKSLEVEGKAELLSSPSWTPPTVSGTTVYLRDRKTIAAVALQ